jgi:glycosyltransferase involved in cell wall biosynthesis
MQALSHPVSDAPFLLLGGDALLTQRSGIGRMTAEVAFRAAEHPGLAGVGLLMGGRAQAFRNALLEPNCLTTAPETTLASLAPRLGEIAALRVARNAWRCQSLARGLRLLHPRRTGVVYHETNFISVPFDGLVCVSVHDLFCLTDPHLVPTSRRRWVERNLPRVLREARGFACVSAYTAAELARLFPEAAGRIRVVPQGVSPIFRPHEAAAAAPALARYGLRDRGYIFAASTLEPRKNFARLQLAFAGLPPSLRGNFPLAIAGGNGWGTALDRIPDGARLLGHVSDQDLAALTARAAVYAFVSEKEGFGLPILEAMASNTPLLTSSGSAMEETAGGAALLTDPLDVDAIRLGLQQLLEDAALCDRLRKAGLARAAGFTWERTTEGLVSLWRAAC